MASVDNSSPSNEPPDLMNDPAYDTNTSKTADGTPAETETCRICRSEATQEEQLFHPCKCSGSIKYVHQECLMEWLSHSQKKHCELCKTPFRFTKLYSPEMPPSLPNTVFFHHLIIHSLSSLLTWSRFAMVSFVWLGWLPWSIRAVWRFLFWLGDGLWILGREPTEGELALAVTKEQLAMLRSDFVNTPNSPTASSGLSLNPFSIPSALAPISQTLNFSNEPYPLTLFKKLFTWDTRTAPVANVTEGFNATSAHLNHVKYSSVLSQLPFFTDITRYPTLNKIIIDTIEGQMIVLLLVVAFILVFLIREWVMQQQPGFDFGDQFDAGLPEDARNPDEEGRNNGRDENAPDVHGMANQRPLPQDPPAAQHLEVPVGARPIAQARQRVHFAPEDQVFHRREPREPGAPIDNRTYSPGPEPEEESGTPASTSVPQRPELPSREALSKIAEIQRSIEESNRAEDQNRHRLSDFMKTWYKEDGEPSELLQMLDAAGHTDKLALIVTLMNSLQSKKAGRKMQEASRVRSVLAGIIIRTQDLQSDISREKSESLLRLLDEATDVEGMESLNQYESANTELVAAVRATQDPKYFDDEVELPPEPQVNGHASGSSHHPDEPKAKEISHDELLHRLNGDPNRADSSDSWSDSDTPLLDRRHGPTPSSADNGDASAPVTGDDTTPDNTQSPSGNDTVIQSENSEGVATEGQSDGPAAPRTRVDQIMDWLWGDVVLTPRRPMPYQDDEYVVHNIENEDPFVPVNHFERDDAEHDHRIEVEAVEEPMDIADHFAEENPDPEALDEGEEFDGVMELIGMRGPLGALFQNAVFSTIILTGGVAIGFWLPYVTGKVVFVVLGDPFSIIVRAPLLTITHIANFIVDVALFFFGSFFYWSDQLVRLALSPLALASRFLARFTNSLAIANATKYLAESGLDGITQLVINIAHEMGSTDIPSFSVTSHQTLLAIKANTWAVFQGFLDVLVSLHREESTMAASKELGKAITALLIFPFSLERFGLAPSNVQAILPDPALAYWGAWDRTVAIMSGYTFFALLAAIYLARGKPFTNSPEWSPYERGLIETLHQAGGVLKVILIISIEMIVFPLYCGLLLDAALLPLFEKATLETRVNFMLHSPWTSIFVHWFVGTCYMFHFALFVSMCRKIMRRGVLYFIRDPDDPTFHPVRDVLERSVATQLRKIAFSALVYGALVIICLGGVVWGLSYTYEGVLPIHWSSNEPVLEFPVDLLFYNFFMPLAVRFMRPSDGLHRMYTWWFRKCARNLRLSWFLFGSRHGDEEGRYIGLSWTNYLTGNQPASPQSVSKEPAQDQVSWVRDGRYVRTPGSDQVRIPKGGHTFIEVDEQNRRIDGQPDTERGPHGPDSSHYTRVYIPPWFRVRVGLFIFFIWIFAATTGVGITIVPLVLGRKIFATLVPAHHRMNDIYAFSIGVYALGGLIYSFIHLDIALSWLRQALHVDEPNGRARILLRSAYAHTTRLCRILYTYTAAGIILPSLFALLMEFYVIIPIHTYLAAPGESHIIHFIQDWTLGVLYVKMCARLLTWHNTRPAAALRGVIRHGWYDPDVRLATRGFIFPTFLILGVALLVPIPLGWAANQLLFCDRSAAFQSMVYRYSYPAVLGVALTYGVWRLCAALLTRWRMAIRDEAYLIGERLHNFGERRASSAAAAASSPGIAVATGGNRLGT
ncbi:MAG: hypothetical protein M4579_000010 [Chaenotheca gracillima]|nr:MAG: hypothetical protein M4579_000010 [Chaenotheca gracillima]